MNVNQSKNELAKLATQLSISDFDESTHQKIKNITELIVQNLGITLSQFSERRRNKLSKNGGFLNGYVLSEKVLPIGQDSEKHKIIRDDKRDTEAGVQVKIGETTPEGIKQIPEKLVRDNIPAHIETMARQNWELCKSAVLKDYKAKIRIALPQEKLKLLKEKLLEELGEFQAAQEKEDILEDLGDVLDVIDEISHIVKTV